MRRGFGASASLREGGAPASLKSAFKEECGMALLNPLTDGELSDYLPFLEERTKRYRE